MLQESCQSPSLENDLLNEKLIETSNLNPKGKSEGSKIKFDLEEKLTKAKVDLTASLKNSELERDQVRNKAEFKKALKWTTSSQVLTSITNKYSNNRRGLGYHSSSLPYIPYSKYDSVKNNLLCTHYGKNGHVKDTFSSTLAVVKNLRKFCASKKISGGLPT